MVVDHACSLLLSKVKKFKAGAGDRRFKAVIVSALNIGLIVFHSHERPSTLNAAALEGVVTSPSRTVRRKLIAGIRCATRAVASFWPNSQDSPGDRMVSLNSSAHVCFDLGNWNFDRRCRIGLMGAEPQNQFIQLFRGEGRGSSSLKFSSLSIASPAV